MFQYSTILWRPGFVSLFTPLPEGANSILTVGLGTLIDFTLLLLLASGFSIAIPVLILAVIAVQRNYIGMARQLKLLNLESRSAVCTNVIEVSGGLPYLRAFQWQQHFMQKTLQRLDSWQKASYYSCSIHRWFRLTLELTILAAALLVVSCAVSRSSKMSPASVSTAMFILMHASHKLCRTMTAWIILQGDMSGISRIQIFVEGTATEGERLDSESELPADWPNMGHLELWNVNAGYRYVFRSVSLIYCRTDLISGQVQVKYNQLYKTSLSN